MDPVVHFEMPADDQKRMCEFYEKAFGWKMQVLGPEMGNYVIVTASERDKDNFPKKRGTINGGFYNKGKDASTEHPSVVIAVDDLKKSIEKVKKAGGKILGDAVEIPGNGTYVSFLDSEGNKVSMIQPIPM